MWWLRGPAAGESDERPASAFGMGGAGAASGGDGRRHPEGCINHALLTRAIANDGLPMIGWVANPH